MKALPKRRRGTWVIVAFLVGACTLDIAWAAEFPTKPIEYVIPWPAGGRSDIAARLISPYLGKNLGVPVVVINKVGGGGLIGMKYIRDVAPDGYTISSGGVSVGYFQYMKPEAVSLWDYTWIARAFASPWVIFVRTNSPFKNLRDLVDYARANPGKLKHGNTGTGLSAHIASEAFAKKFKIKLTQVSYKGEGDTVKGIGAGEVDLASGLFVAFRPLVESGQLRPLGAADKSRDPLFPEVPTFKEQGFDFTELLWETIHIPKAVPKNITDKISDACRKALTDPELKAKFAKIGINLAYQSGPEFTEYLRAWDKELKELIFTLGLQLKK